MMKKSLFLLFFAIILTSCSSFKKMRQENFSKTLSKNLIENGDFEINQEHVDNTLTGWLLDKDSFDKVSIDSTRSFTGSNSLKISQPSREMQLISHPFPTNHRNVYGITLAAKSVLKKIPIAVHFLTFSDNGKIISKYYTNITVDTKWQSFNFVSDHLKVNSEFGRVFITIPKNDSVLLLDDINCFIIDAHQKK